MVSRHTLPQNGAPHQYESPSAARPMSKMPSWIWSGWARASGLATASGSAIATGSATASRFSCKRLSIRSRKIEVFRADERLGKGGIHVDSISHVPCHRTEHHTSTDHPQPRDRYRKSRSGFDRAEQQPHASPATMSVSKRTKCGDKCNVVLTMLAAAKFAISPPVIIGAASTPVRVAPTVRTDTVMNFMVRARCFCLF